MLIDLATRIERQLDRDVESEERTAVERGTSAEARGRVSGWRLQS
jgi:hypothetical protein